ncbi:OmpA family protein [Devosia sp. A449]
MIRDLIKWVAPGLATVLGGTSLCLAMTSGEIATDLAAKSATAMAVSGHDWAELALDGRDLTLSGTATDPIAVKAATTRLASIAGLGPVTTEVALAPLAKPYQFTARIKQGAVSLAGGVPDEATRQRLLARAGLTQGELDLRSGMPERRSWVAGAEFAIDQLQYFDQGQAVISDLTVNLSGRAKSERAFRDLLIVMRAGAPAGVTLGTVDITPALVAPYQWSASFDGKRIDVTGFVPDDTMAERYRTADVSGLPVATGLALGSGEPAGFAELSQQLIEQLARLDYGTASITDSDSTLSGAPPSLEVAQAIVDTLAPSGSIVVLEPPRIAEYWMSATRQPGGVVVFDGYAPDEATREAFSLLEGADTSYLQLGRGAPERYRSGADFGLAALALMSEGRIALRDNVLTIAGIARSGADYAALLAILADQAPQGLVLARAEIEAPRVTNYDWSATKDIAGTIALTGAVPSPNDAALLLSTAGQGATETMAYASGAPRDFVATAQTGLGLLQGLSEGRVAYDGHGWTLTGTASSPSAKAALEADFVSRQLAASGWSMAVAEPQSGNPTVAIAEPEIAEPVVAEPAVAEPVIAAEAAPVAAPPAPAIDPDYAFSASRAADGTVILSGQLPTDAAMRYFGTISGGDFAAVSLAQGAPADFLASAETGLRALLQLSEGQINFANGNWSLSGVAADATTQTMVLAALNADSGAATWGASVELPAPAPEPEPVAAPSQPVATLPVDITACAAQVADFSARNAILFQSGAAIIAAESNAALDELSMYLAACPDAVVHVEGHTDSDGDEALNLALSVARAEAVVGALVARGIGAGRLYAIGYGESVPVADNATAQGKRLNRRIVVIVQPQHF